MRQYQDLLERILFHGIRKQNRTRTEALSIFGYQMRFDLREGFPLITTKWVPFKSIVHELLWFLAGDTNVKYLNDHNGTNPPASLGRSMANSGAPGPHRTAARSTKLRR